MKELKSYGDLTVRNKCRDLLDTVGRDTLERIAHGYLDLLDTSAAIYEVDGGYATALFTSSYCRFLDRTSRALCGTGDNEEALASGKWLCHESCWTEASRVSVKTGKPYDLRPCDGGINIYAVPIKAGERIIGSVNFGYGSPPTDEKTIDEMASRYKVDRAELLRAAKEYMPRPDYVIDVAKKHIHLAAELIGELYLRKQTEEAIKKYARELEDANRLKDLFTDIMRHDLLNPAGVVRGSAELLLDEDPDNVELKMIKRSADKLIEMIESASKLAKLESAGELEKENLDLKMVIDNVVMDCKPLLESVDMRVINRVSMSMPVKANPVIGDVFLNLLSNAVKYAADGEKVVIEALDMGESIKVMVKDYGPGIPDEDKADIFERFTRREKAGVKGIGLGLAIAKRIVDLHNGRVWVEDNPGGGSIFYVQLPK